MDNKLIVVGVGVAAIAAYFMFAKPAAAGSAGNAGGAAGGVFGAAGGYAGQPGAKPQAPALAQTNPIGSGKPSYGLFNAGGYDFFTSVGLLLSGGSKITYPESILDSSGKISKLTLPELQKLQGEETLLGGWSGNIPTAKNPDGTVSIGIPTRLADGTITWDFTQNKVPSKSVPSTSKYDTPSGAPLGQTNASGYKSYNTGGSIITRDSNGNVVSVVPI